MFRIFDGRDSFFQWDLNRRLIVEDNSINEVHFCNKTDDSSLVCAVHTEDGLRVADVPNILLQTDWSIRAYAYCTDHTIVEEIFKVHSRNKPADYIYTETEIKNYDDLKARVDEIERVAADIPTVDSTLTKSGQAADAAAVGNRLSTLSEEIAAIPSGADGKSAYQYAQDGGYTGTETEFAAKLAQEKFANPNALTFTGAVAGIYDGSSPLRVEIPSGGGGSGGAVGWKLIRTINIVSGTSSYSFNTDNNGNAFKIKNFLILIDAYPANGYLEIKPNGYLSFLQKPFGKQNYPFSFMMKRVTDGRYILENSNTSNSIFERTISGEYASFGEFTSFAFWFSVAPAADTTMYILGEDV